MIRACLNGLTNLAEELEPVWVAGLALAQIWLGSRWLPLKGEAYEWAQYLLLGTVFPAIVLASCILNRRYDRRLPWITLKWCLLGFCLAFPWFRARHSSLSVIAVIAVVQCAAMMFFARRDDRDAGDRAAFLGRALACVMVASIAWLASVRFIWWRSLAAELTDIQYRRPWREWTIVVASALLVAGGLFYASNKKTRVGSYLSWFATICAVVVIVLASFRVDSFPGYAFHHWSAIVGPAELVRQGGWLLWDVPCQYGFLSTLSVALLPTENVWQSLYLINSLTLLFSAGFLFYVLRSLQTGVLGVCLSLAVTLAAVLLIPGFAPAAIGPWAFPAVGAFRFFWCYVLLAVLVWESRTATGSATQRLVLGVGCFLWLVGSLWSVESSTYCAAIWLPAFAVMVWRRVLALQPQDSSIRSRMLACGQWFVVPAGLFLATLAAIHLYYVCFLGHGPDWAAWTEYARAFAGGYYALPINPQGTVWALLLVFATVSCGVAVYIRQEGVGDRLALLTGAWGALWAVSSYFVSRSHENNCTCLSPFLCLIAAIVLQVFADRLATHRFRFLLKVAAAPLFTLLIAVSFGDRLILGNFLHDLPRGYTQCVERRLPSIDPALVDLLKSAGVDPHDPLIFLDSEATQSVLLPAWPSTTRAPTASSYTAWLPAAPAVLLAPLPEERRRVYCQRFAERTRMSGWLIQPNAPTSSSMTWCQEQIHETHLVGATSYQNAKWQVCWVEYKSPERVARLKEETLEEKNTRER